MKVNHKKELSYKISPLHKNDKSTDKIIKKYSIFLLDVFHTGLCFSQPNFDTDSTAIKFYRFVCSFYLGHTSDTRHLVNEVQVR